MFKNIQKEVDELEDFINEHSRSGKDDIFVLLAFLIAETGEVADEIKGMEGKRAEDPDSYTKGNIAKEIVDVILNLLRITRFYNIDLDEHFIKRIEGIKVKWEKLVKPTKIYIDKDAKARLDYWESQFSGNYSKGEINSTFKQVLRNNLKGIKKGNFLDHACGEGHLKRYFDNLGWETWGVEQSWNALAKAAKNSPKNLTRSFIEKLPFKDNSFDVVISRRMLHSSPLEERRLAIKECCRVLKSGGLFICSVQSINDKLTLKKYKQFGIELDYDKNTYVADILIKGKRKQRLKHFYSKDDIKNEIEQNSSLKIKKVDEISEKAGWCLDFQKYLVISAVKS